MIRILLIEDHVSYGQSLAGMADLQPDLKVVAALNSGTAAADLAVEHDIDIAIVDLDLRGQSGVEAMLEVRARRPSTACVVLTALTDAVELGRAVEAGASAVLHKSLPVSEVFDVVRAVAAGANRLDPNNSARWLAALAKHREEGWRARVTADSLSEREKEVLQLLANGSSSAKIARSLGISEATVHTHIRNLRAKLGVGTRLEAVVEGLRLGLIDGPA